MKISFESGEAFNDALMKFDGYVAEIRPIGESKEKLVMITGHEPKSDDWQAIVVMDYDTTLGGPVGEQYEIVVDEVHIL